MSDPLADLWKSDSLINHQVINNLSAEELAKVNEILSKLK